MPLTPGAKLGPYQVTAAIGAGGMGEVYRARDTKLNRDVALKVLPELFANDAERMARFQREAYVLASLNHPNIAAIYGLGEADDTRALVLELVEGPTLADRIAQGPIPIDEALPIAKQIAEALEAAHEQCIIHRDLKPANIKLRPDGTVKVLDFGLAKALEGEQAEVDQAHSPTLSMTAAATRAGFILGTAAYMSPEQAKGRPVDKRTDMWAFGVVLYEMLTGRQAFGGTDISETLAAVLKTDLDLDALPAGTPRGVRKVIARCLQKDRQRRARDIGDVGLDLEDAAAAPDDEARTAGAATRPPLARWQRPVPVAIALAAALALGAAATATLLRPASPAPVVTRLSIAVDSLTGLNLGRQLAVAPDGRHVVFRGPGAALWVREIGQLQARPIPGTEGASQPFVSPDGRWIGFHDQGQLKRIEAAGGVAVPIADVEVFGGGSWEADDTILFASWDNQALRTGVYRVAATGGTPELLFSLDWGQWGRDPQRLPGGDWILLTGSNMLAGGLADVVAHSVSTGERTVLVEAAYLGRYVPSGHLLYGRNGVLFGVPFDAATLEVLGGPVPLVEGITSQMDPPAYHYDVAANGTLAYVPGLAATVPRTLVWVDRSGAEEPLPVPPANFVGLSLSPDGSRVALDREDTGKPEVWVAEMDRGSLTPLTTDIVRSAYPGPIELLSVTVRPRELTSDVRVVRAYGLRRSRCVSCVNR